MNLPITEENDQRLYILITSLQAERLLLLRHDKKRVTNAEIEDLRAPLELSDWQRTLNHMNRKLRTSKKCCGEHVPCLGFYLFKPSERFLEWDETVRLSEILPTPHTLERLNGTGDPAPLYFLPLLREVLKRPYHQKNMLGSFRVILLNLISAAVGEFRDLAYEPVGRPRSTERSAEVDGLTSDFRHGLPRSTEVDGLTSDFRHGRPRFTEVGGLTSDLGQGRYRSTERSAEVDGLTSDFRHGRPRSTERSADVNGLTSEFRHSRPRSTEWLTEVNVLTSDFRHDRLRSPERSAEVDGLTSDFRQGLPLFNERSAEVDGLTSDFIHSLSRSTEVDVLTSNIEQNIRHLFGVLNEFDDLMQKCEPLWLACSYLFTFQGPVTMRYAHHLFILYSYFELLVGFAFEDLQEIMGNYRRLMETYGELRRLVM